MNKIMSFGLVLMLIGVLPVAALDNRYDPFVDLDHIDWFDRELYFAGFDSRPCVDLKEFYAYADSDRYDRHDREDVLDYKDRLSAADYQRLADMNPSDNIDISDFDDRDDFHCSTRSEFDQFADSNRYDNVDRDDFFHRYGYDDENQFLRINRHRPYEYHGANYDIYGRADGYGGYASLYRPSYRYTAPYTPYSNQRVRDYGVYPSSKKFDIQEYVETSPFFGRNPYLFD